MRSRDSAIVCVFAKPARPGKVKTRLTLGSQRANLAAKLAAAFFADTWAQVSALGWARAIVATTDVTAAQWRSLPSDSIWPQGEGDLGERLEHILGRALGQADVALAIGADTPGLPTRVFLAARDALRTADAALGPADDGGFYLLALKRCPPGLLRDLPWSDASTCSRTRARLEAHGMAVRMLEPWFDVDRPEDLGRLRARIAQGDVVAPVTAALLASMPEEKVQGPCG